jgi:selenocysteine lyase/cysteine desulfurase
MSATREDLVTLAREATAGVHRPSYCENPASFDPHEWVLEAMQRAYERAYERGVRDGRRLEHEATIGAVLA